MQEFWTIDSMCFFCVVAAGVVFFFVVCFCFFSKSADLFFRPPSEFRGFFERKFCVNGFCDFRWDVFQRSQASKSLDSWFGMNILIQNLCRSLEYTYSNTSYSAICWKIFARIWSNTYHIYFAIPIRLYLSFFWSTSVSFEESPGTIIDLLRGWGWT